MRRHPPLAAAAILGMLAACTTPSTPSRVIDPEPTTHFDETSLTEREQVFRFALDTAKGRAEWEIRDADGGVALTEAVASTPGPLHVPKDWSPRWLQRSVEFDAATIDRIVVDGSGKTGIFTLCWAGETGGFHVDRCTKSATGTLLPIDFPLGRHPHWRGPIRWIRVRSLHSPGDWWISGMAGYRTSVKADHLVEAKVELARDTRSAWAVSPGRAVSRTVAVPHGGRLRLGLGASDGFSSVVRFEIRAKGEDEPLLRHDLRDADLGRWTDVEIDLARWAGGDVELELRATTPEGGPAIAFWGAPVIVGERGVPPKGVVLVSVDTLRADHLSLYGYSRPTSPNLEAWAERRGVVFEETVAAAPWTLPSHVSLLSGASPFLHGVNRAGPIPARVALLAEQFRTAGYLTHATTAGALVTASHGFHRGFDRFVARVENMNDREQSERELAEGIDEVIDWIEANREQPFFVFLHTYEPHTPFCPREPWFTSFSGAARPLDKCAVVAASEAEGPFGTPYVFFDEGAENRGDPAAVRQGVVDLYDSGLAYVDEQVGRLLDYLERSGLAERTVVALTSDHGESLFEREMQAHFHLLDENLLVPLVIAAPGKAPRRVATQVRSVDVAPTLVALAGLEPLAGADGVSLANLLDGGEEPPREAWSYSPGTQWGIGLRRSGSLKYILRDRVDAREGIAPGDEHLFDLRADPGERKDLSGSRPTTSLRAEAVAQLAEAPGLRLDLVNRAGDDPLLVHLGGLPVAQSIVTAADPRALPASRDDGGGLHLSVPSGESVSLLLQDHAPGTLEVRVGPAEDPETSRAVELGEGPLDLAATWRHGEWQWADTTASPASERALRLYTRESGTASDAHAADHEEALRSLGYVH